jgi:hypothetical protein
LLIDRENLVKNNKIEDDKVEDGENGVEIADCEDFFFANHIDCDAEDFAGNSENDIEIIDYVRFFFVSYTNRGAISPYSTNFVIIIAAIKIANIYRS